MTLRSWGIIKSIFADDAFSGEGAWCEGGRWNSQGTRMVYTSATASLALLEILVHLDSSAPLPSYSLICVEFSESLIEIVDCAMLPANWREFPVPPAVQIVGDQWVEGLHSVVLEVPSVILPQERNHLINPNHPELDKHDMVKPQPFVDQLNAQRHSFKLSY